jgi:Ca2+-binding EF-hand superfamily protein
MVSLCSMPVPLMVLALLVSAWTSVHSAPAEGDEDTDANDEHHLSVEQMHGVHSKMDRDNDGKVSMGEVLSFSHEMRKNLAMKDINAVLQEMDTDGDGKVGITEFLTEMDQHEGGTAEEQRRVHLDKERFKAADDDKNGVLDAQELPGLFYPEVNKAVLEVSTKATLDDKDKNKDGVLTPREFWELDGPEGARDIMAEELADFQRLDKDGSGTLDLAELNAWEAGHFHTEQAMQRLFDLADVDSDLHVTAEELANARGMIAGSEAQYHLMDWVESQEL